MVLRFVVDIHTTCFGLHGHLQVCKIFCFLVLKESASLQLNLKSYWTIQCNRMLTYNIMKINVFSVAMKYNRDISKIPKDLLPLSYLLLWRLRRKVPRNFSVVPDNAWQLTRLNYHSHSLENNNLTSYTRYDKHCCAFEIRNIEICSWRALYTFQLSI
jgi:hypothetical protein